MSKQLPRSHLLQDEINNLLGLDQDCWHGNGIPLMNLGRGDLLRLLLAVIKIGGKKR